MATDTVQPDQSKPFSHLVTGVVLRAFAAHETYRRSAEAKAAGKLLDSRFFRRDLYPDRGTPEYWTRFTYPFWFTDLLSSLDSLSFLGFNLCDSQVKAAVQWFAEEQQKNGLWYLSLLKNGKKKDLNTWYAWRFVVRLSVYTWEFEAGNTFVAYGRSKLTVTPRRSMLVMLFFSSL